MGAASVTGKGLGSANQKIDRVSVLPIPDNNDLPYDATTNLFPKIVAELTDFPKE